MKRLLWVMLLGCSLAWGQPLEIIHLKHRNAEAVLPQLQPFLEPGGALSGTNGTIFLRASVRNRAEIKSLLATLDTPVRRLMISVRQDGNTSDEGSGAGISGRVAIGGGAPVISGRGHLYQSDRSSRRDTLQQVQTIDGGRAAIMVGQSFFVPLRQLVLTPGGAVVSEQLIQRDLGTGFVAVPKLNGDRVTIEISPRDDTPGPLPGSVNVQRLNTTVSGRLGEWLELGGSVAERSGTSGAITSYRAGSSTRQRRLLLKVDALP
ncbi:MAG: type II and III secretion system protein [Sulfuritalea sp.]|nr:type II and III secretion system protein [Sulfuritalea sp.]